MSIVGKIKRAVRGDVDAKAAALEVVRRGRVAISESRERESLADVAQQPARLRAPFADMSSAELLSHFRSRQSPSFLPGLSTNQAASHVRQFPQESRQLLDDANDIVDNHSWSILGLGRQSFGHPIQWHRDLLTAREWPVTYHAEINLTPGDGSDVRVLWELNRLPHFLTLARAYAMNGDERFAKEFVQQFDSWRSQNPYGHGVNWSCAMEVALRSINLVGAFEVFRYSDSFDEQALAAILAGFDHHGRYIREHLEFSHIATSNHYLSDVAGLAWLGIMLPELEAAAEWREFGLRELLREMDKQVLPDGADYEASTGYHRFVVEIFLYTFILCRAHSIEIDEKYWNTLRSMFGFIRAYLRPDGRAPLIGDTDGGQMFPVRPREGDDHAYVLAVGAALFRDSDLAPPNFSTPEEVAWILGAEGVDNYRGLQADAAVIPARFPDAGIAILGADDLYLNFNTTDAGINGRGSHGHNDALSIEVSAFGKPFIVDPGTYVYTGDLDERHRFRSTAYHSTIEVDGQEQNTTEKELPFIIGNEAKPRVLLWEIGEDLQRVSAEHFGYERLSQPITHRRTITFNKEQKSWLIEDELIGFGDHEFVIRFHFDSGIEVSVVDQRSVIAKHAEDGPALLVQSLDVAHAPEIEEQYCSKNYLEKSRSSTARWTVRANAPCQFRWRLIAQR